MTNWFMITKPEPRSVVQIIPYDKDGRVLVMHRSNEVRSAKNVWSFPSGLHKIGETWQQCAIRELYEEYVLDIQQLSILGLYENIAGDTELDVQSHWMILVVAAQVPTVTAAVNKEPKKHDKMELCKLEDLEDTDTFLAEHVFHESFHRFFTLHSQAIVNKIRKEMTPHDYH